MLFRGRHFRDEMIVLCVRWYPRYPLSCCDLEEMMAERGTDRGSLHHRTLGPALWTDLERTDSARDAASKPVMEGG